jgi:hypothetical protein
MNRNRHSRRVRALGTGSLAARVGGSTRDRIAVPIPKPIGAAAEPVQPELTIVRDAHTRIVTGWNLNS